ncbi:hypothetical protein AX17_003977 [Amanita inopinata Kibby_2008]|nr:hypothetical protein AX17_003977 [Amanita inopinata Kibby_2008]
MPENLAGAQIVLTDSLPSSIPHPPRISDFRFSTIGKQPELLKRISAPQPDQEYQVNSTSRSGSPIIEHTEMPLSRPSLLQALTGSSVAPTTVQRSTCESSSDESQIAAVTTPDRKPSSLFDPYYRQLYTRNAQIADTASTTRTESHPEKHQDTSSDMDWTPLPLSPCIILNPVPTVLATVQSTPASAERRDHDVCVAQSPQSSTDSLDSLELSYPQIEPASLMSNGADDAKPDTIPPPVAIDARQMLQTTSKRIRQDDIFSEIGKLHSRLLATTISLDSASVHQSKILDVESLELNVQTINFQVGLALQKAYQAQILAKKSLEAARESVIAAEDCAAAADTAKSRADQTLATLAQLRQENEKYGRGTNSVQGSVDHNATIASLKRDVEALGQLVDRLGEDATHNAVEAIVNSRFEPVVIHTTSAQVTKTAHEHSASPRFRKRKRISNFDSASSPSPPSKEVCSAECHLALDKTIEMEAEAAREAWDRELQRRSVVPPETETETRPHDEQTVDGQLLQAKAISEVNQDVSEQTVSQGSQDDPLMSSATKSPSSHNGVQLNEQQNLTSSQQDVGMEDVVRKRSKELKEQRLCQIGEQRSEIAESQIQRRREARQSAEIGETNEIKSLVGLQTGRHDHASSMSLPVAPFATGIAQDDRSGSSPRQTQQQKGFGVASPALKRKVELRLAQLKQAQNFGLDEAQDMSCNEVQASPKNIEQAEQMPVWPGRERTHTAEQRAESIVFNQATEKMDQARETAQCEEKEKTRREADVQSKQVSADIATEIQTGKTRAKQYENENITLIDKRTTPQPCIGNVVARQTLASSPIKQKSNLLRYPASIDVPLHTLLPSSASPTIQPRPQADKQVSSTAADLQPSQTSDLPRPSGYSPSELKAPSNVIRSGGLPSTGCILESKTAKPNVSTESSISAMASQRPNYDNILPPDDVEPVVSTGQRWKPAISGVPAFTVTNKSEGYAVSRLPRVRPPDDNIIKVEIPSPKITYQQDDYPSFGRLPANAIQPVTTAKQLLDGDVHQRRETVDQAERLSRGQAKSETCSVGRNMATKAVDTNTSVDGAGSVRALHNTGVPALRPNKIADDRRLVSCASDSQFHAISDNAHSTGHETSSILPPGSSTHVRETLPTSEYPNALETSDDARDSKLSGTRLETKPSRSWSYSRSSSKTAPVAGRKRFREDDIADRHWSPGERRSSPDRRRRCDLPNSSRGDPQFPRTPSRSRSRSRSSYSPRSPRVHAPSLASRIDPGPRVLATGDPEVFRVGNGGQSYRPMRNTYRPGSPVDVTPREPQGRSSDRNPNEYCLPTRPSPPHQPQLLNRFMIDKQDAADYHLPNKKHNTGSASHSRPSRGNAKYRGRGGSKSLEQRISSNPFTGLIHRLESP